MRQRDGDVGPTSEQVDDLLERWALADRTLDATQRRWLNSPPVVTERTVYCVEQLLGVLRPGAEARMVLASLDRAAVQEGIRRRRERAGVSDPQPSRYGQGWSR